MHTPNFLTVLNGCFWLSFVRRIFAISGPKFQPLKLLWFGFKFHSLVLLVLLLSSNHYNSLLELYFLVHNLIWVAFRFSYFLFLIPHYFVEVVFFFLLEFEVIFVLLNKKISRVNMAIKCWIECFQGNIRSWKFRPVLLIW